MLKNQMTTRSFLLIILSANYFVVYAIEIGSRLRKNISKVIEPNLKNPPLRCQPDLDFRGNGFKWLHLLCGYQ